MPGDYVNERDYQLFIKEQTAFTTPVYPVAGDASRFKNFEAAIEESREPRPDNKGTRSRGATVLGKKSGTWSAGGPYSPSGSLGVASDIGLILKYALGKQTINTGTSVVYDPLKDIESTLKGLSFSRYGNHFHDIVWGAIVNEFSFNFSGDGLVEWSASGPCVDKGFAGSSLIQTSLVGGESAVVVTAGEGRKFAKNGKIDIGTSTGHTITSVSGDTVNITPVVVGAQASGLAVIPNEPTGTVAGSPIHGVTGAVTVDGAAITIIGGNVTINNGFELRMDEYGTATATGFRASALSREATFSLDLHLTKDLFKFYGDAFNNAQRDLQITLGNTAGRKTIVDMDKVEFTSIPGLPVPDGGEAQLTLEGVALPTATEDEIKITEA